MSDWIHTRNGQIFLSHLRKIGEALEKLAEEIERMNDLLER